MKSVFLILLILTVGCANRKMNKQFKQQKELTNVQFSEGSGDSYEDAVVISGVEKQSQGMEAEYSYISKKHGQKNKDWSIVGQTIIREGKKVFDVIEIQLGTDSSRRIYYFDVTSFPWKK